jgi:hypothetical protein
MITAGVRFALILTTTVLAGGTAAWTSVARPASSFALTEPSTAVADLPGTSPVAAEPRIDVYGNEIQDAVGDYRIDPRGDVYENHAPDTEVARLAPPTI